MSSTKKSTSSTKFDPKQAALFTKNYNDAQSTASLPFTPFTGESVAPLSGNESLAVDMAPQMFNAGMPALQRAESTATGLTDYKAPDMMAALQKFQNPYTSGVVDAALGDIEHSRQMQRSSDDQRTPMGAFGGSRHGVADSLRDENFGRIAASTAATLRDQGFRTAAGLADSEASHDLNAAQMRGSSAGLLGELGNDERTGMLDSLNSLIATGGLERGVRQGQDSAAQQEFMRKAMFPYFQQGIRDSSLGSLQPVLESTTTNKESTGGLGPILSGLGGLALAAGTGGASLGLGGLGGLFGGGMPGMMSMTPQIFGSNVGGYMGR